jgi:hypothetical protein
MRARWKYIGISTLIIVVLLSGGNSTIEAVSLQGSQSIHATGIIEYPQLKIGIYITSWNFNEYNASTIASTFDMSQSACSPDWSQHPDWDYTTKMNQVRALNPNYKFLVYRNCISIYNYWVDEWNYAQSQGWLLKDINGSYVTEPWIENYMVDITNPAYQRWVATIIKSWIDQYGFDGVMADNSLKHAAHDFDGCGKTRPINPRTGTYFTDTEILDGCAGMLNAIIDAIGTSKIGCPNGIGSGFVWASSEGDGYRYILSKVNRLNALGSEGTFSTSADWLSETQWKQSVDMVVWIQDNFLAGHPERYFSGACYRGVPSGATAEQVILYGYCSMLLATKYSSPQNTMDFGFNNHNLPNSNQLQLLQMLRSVDMSEPSGDYYKITSTSVYARDFVRGKVLVNPTDVPYTITLDGSYVTIDGTTISGSLTVYAHSGVVLFK